MGTLYKPVAHVVGLLSREGQEDLQGMSVVFCSLSEGNGAGFLGLFASPEPFRIREQDYLLVYTPTAPIPIADPVKFEAESATSETHKWVAPDGP
jgi:uncharacterized membrane protein